MSISWLKLNYLSTVIPQTIIYELLTGTVPLKNHLPELFQQKNKENISGGLNYSRRLLHTHACLGESSLWNFIDPPLQIMVSQRVTCSKSKIVMYSYSCPRTI